MAITDIATITSDATTPALAVNGRSAAAEAMDRLAEWVRLGDQAHALVSRLASSAFIPAAFRTSGDGSIIANATAAVLFGASLGWDPLTSLQQVYIVHGRPGLYARAKVALLQSRGFRIRTVELTDETCTVAGNRPGEDEQTVTVTMAMAERAGWTSNGAYKKTPQDMLYARAAGRLCDRIGADVLLGIATVEDIPDDAGPVRVDATTGAPIGRVTAAALLGPSAPAADDTWRPAQPGETPGQVDPDDARAEDPQAAAPPHITDAQRSRLSELLRATGRDRQTPARRYLTERTGRPIQSAADLTEAEADDVLAALTAEVENAEGEPA